MKRFKVRVRFIAAGVACATVAAVLFAAVVAPASADTNVDSNTPGYTMTSRTDEGIYEFSYPDICDYTWDANALWVATRCPASAPFKEYEVRYGSGTSGTRYGYYNDNMSNMFPADGEWHSVKVQTTPHPYKNGCPSAFNVFLNCWTKLQIIPDS
ncbi:MAG TPA: hypothetical protein VK816_05160 [Jatrophihabitantaceae bacterium]|nr:hypothetical protein [Jatrophihabitantaceae bacterium]